MAKIAVVGDYDSIYGFAALGLDTFPVKEEEAPALMHKLTGQEYGIIYITEALAEKIPGILEHYAGLISPAIILIPGSSNNTGAGVAGVRKSVEQAVGSDILFGNN